MDHNLIDILFLIRKREYPNCPTEKKIDFETMEEWIKDGCNLRDEEGKFVGKAEKIPWVPTHPKHGKLDELEARIKKLEEQSK